MSLVLCACQMLSAGSACVLPASIRVPVPAHVHAGLVLSPGKRDDRPIYIYIRTYDINDTKLNYSLHIVFRVPPLSVPAHNCDDTETWELFTSSDPHFSAGRRGIVALADVMVPAAGWTFAVWARDASGHESEMEVQLVRERVFEIYFSVV